MSHVTFIYLLGWGGMAFETAGGAQLLRYKVNKLHGTFCPPLFQYTDGASAAQLIHESHPDEKIMLVGDSCGANRITWVATMVHPRPIDYMFAINASVYCNINCPPVADNVKEFVCMYGGARTFGLSQYEAPLNVPPTHWEKYTDTFKKGIGNNGKTEVTYEFVDAAHPNDWDVLNVHDPIVKKAQELINS